MRWRWALTWILCAALTAGLFVLWLAADGDQASAASSVVAAVIGLFGVMSVWAWQHPARRGRSSTDQLADATNVLARLVRRQWQDEAALRQLFDPTPLPVVWADSSLPTINDHRQLIGDPITCSASEPETLAAAFRSLLRRRLVVLGEAGAGKTTFTVLLALALLDNRSEHEPVPVVLSLASFDPSREEIRSWLARRIAVEYPALTATDVYGPTAIEDLLGEHRILPILDGLDEGPAASRGAVLRALNETLDSQAPLVLTCRTVDYSHIVSESGVLTGAAVVEPSLVDARDAIELLYLATPRDHRQERWRLLAQHVERHPQGPAAQALTSPLTIALARMVYADQHGDPVELIDGRRFSTRTAIEYHLLEALVPTLYARLQRRQPNRPWHPEQAEHYLAHIAARLQRQNTYDLVWWQIYQWVPALTTPWRRSLSAAAVTLIALLPSLALPDPALWAGWFHPISIVATASITFTVSAISNSRAARAGRPALVTLIGALAGGATITPLAFLISLSLGADAATSVVSTFASVSFPLWLVLSATGQPVPPLNPSRSRLASTYQRHSLRRAITIATSITIACGVAAMSDAYLEGQEPSPAIIWGGVVIGAVIGMSVAALTVVRAPVTTDEPTTCTSTIKADRRICIVSGTVGALTIVTTFASFSLISGDLRSAVSLGWSILLSLGPVGLSLALAAHSWPYYCIARLLLAAGGRLPWRLQSFLAEAHRLGILRQVGPVFQFRHARLQQHLADQVRVPAPRSPSGQGVSPSPDPRSPAGS
ncbi:NACHT domain-containing protein [Streptomyces sp. NPDC046931]|uniref:NACHT domain-containing protein n=1 Tax=Streptomyces sp. NPDC046931 TaxID=3154806 RepID=UPI0033DCDE98